MAASLLVGSLFCVLTAAGAVTGQLTNRDVAYVPASITGTVTDASGNPITSRDICVDAYGDGSATATTDANGNYAINVSVPGSGAFYVQASDCAGSARNDVPTSYSTTADGAPALVSVTGGVTATGINIKMTIGASISGTITDANGNPITTGDICVEAYSSYALGGGYGQATTDGAGAYDIEHLPAGTYSLYAYDCQGSTRNDVPTYYGETSTAPYGTAVTLASGEALTATDIQMTAGGSISGTITDASGNPITTGDICVEAYSNDALGAGYGQATTGVTGAYDIPQLPAGDYSIYAYDCQGSARNDLPTYYGQSAANPYGTTIAVVSGEPHTGADIQMQPATTISGHVYGGAGTSTPLSGACVTVTDASSGGWRGAAQTASDGSYTVAGLTPGEADTLEFTPCEAGSAWSSSYYLDSPTPAGATAITPTAASPATNIDGHLPPSGSISGSITDAAGQPITSQDVCVSAGLTVGDLTRYGQTDASGNYTVTGLSAGSYYVKAYDCRTSTREDLPTYYSSSTGVQRTEVTVASGADTGSINVQLAAGTSISGAVYGGGGTSNPLPDACIEALRASSGRGSASTGTAADGSYTLRRLTPGIAYDVHFADCSGNDQYVYQYYDGATSRATATSVTPTVASRATGIDAHLQPGGTITGTVGDSSGNPITSDDICLSAEPADGGEGYGSATSTNTGTYTITDLPPGSYDVYAYDCPGSSRTDLGTYYSTAADGSPTAVTVTSGQTTGSIDLHMLAGTSISGHVYGGSGTAAPIAGACVTAYGAASSTAEGSATTASDGSYTITGLTADVGYKVEFDPCRTGSTYAIQYYNQESTLATADVLTPSAANPSTGIDAHFTGGAAITGTVTDSAGNPITTQDICVTAVPYAGGTYTQASTDASGHYAVTGLSPGSYYVEFADCAASSRDDVVQYYGGGPYESGSTLVVLASGGTATGIDAHMQAGTSISGHVYAGTGTSNPLNNVCVQVDSVSGTGTNNYYYYYYGVTDSSGAYTISHVAPTTAGYRVEFVDCSQSVTYVSQYFGGTYDYNTATAVIPAVASPATGIDGHLDFGGSITGTVSDNSGAVTSGVCAQAYLSGTTFYYGYSYRLSATGGYTIGGLPAGDYTVNFYDCGSRNDVPQTLASPVAVTLGVATTNVDVTMAPAATISGIVYGGPGTGTPVSGACVQAVNPSTGESISYSETFTDGTGAYEIKHLPPGGTYAVQFNCFASGQDANWGTQYYDGVSNLAQAAVLSPTLASPSTGIDANLPSGAPIATVTGGPANGAETNQSSASFAFVANESGATFSCALDGGAYAPCTSPYDTGTLASGPHTFSVEAMAGGKTEVSPPYVHWTIAPSSPTSTSQGEVTAGGTFTSDPGGTTSTSTPVIVDVTPPANSEVTMTTEPTTTPSGNGYSIFGQQVDISAAQPDGTGAVTGTAADPIQIQFTVDQSQIPSGTAISSITVTRNGTPAANCAAQDGTATPDPCVESRTQLASGDVQIVVLTTHASTWNLATQSTPVPAPVNTQEPAAPTGIAQDGQTLAASDGSWSNAPTSYQYQWEDCNPGGGSCSTITRATSKTYLLAASDVGHTIRVQVTATNAGGSSAPALSAASGVVQAAGGAPGSGGPGSGSGVSPPSATAAVGKVTINGTTAIVSARCTGAAGQSCRLSLVLTAVEVIKGGKVVAVTAAKARRAAVNLGTKATTVAAGTSARIAIALNSKGKHLLTALKVLHVEISVALAASTASVHRSTLTFRSTKKTAKRSH